MEENYGLNPVQIKALTHYFQKDIKALVKEIEEDVIESYYTNRVLGSKGNLSTCLPDELNQRGENYFPMSIIKWKGSCFFLWTDKIEIEKVSFFGMFEGYVDFKDEDHGYSMEYLKDLEGNALEWAWDGGRVLNLDDEEEFYDVFGQPHENWITNVLHSFLKAIIAHINIKLPIQRPHNLFVEDFQFDLEDLKENVLYF